MCGYYLSYFLIFGGFNKVAMQTNISMNIYVVLEEFIS
jgi:hypothetical protein